MDLNNINGIERIITEEIQSIMDTVAPLIARYVVEDIMYSLARQENPSEASLRFSLPAQEDIEEAIFRRYDRFAAGVGDALRAPPGMDRSEDTAVSDEA